MDKLNVVITDYSFPGLLQEHEVLESIGCNITAAQCKTAAEVIAVSRHADAILTQFAPITADVIAELKQCKIIVRYGIGVDNIDLDAAKGRGIPVVNVPDYAINEVADHAFSLMLSSVRKIPNIVSQVRSGLWENAPCRPIRSLHDKIIGVAGFGNIAKAVIKRAQAFGMSAIGYDPFVEEQDFLKLGVEKVDWYHLLERCDILSIHLPLTPKTRYLFNLSAFERMKNTAYLINTSRGGVIEANDLVKALESNRIAGAALDVLEEEPIEPDNPLLKLDNCLITSHCAWYSEESLLRLQLYAALEIKRMFVEGKPRHIVNGVICP